MKARKRVLFVTIVPSPYQRDLFRALAARVDVDLAVDYLEAASPDSPWPKVPLESYERILPGFWLPFGGARWQVNWHLPDVSQFDFVVLSSFTSLTGQWLMQSKLSGRRWLFWGERLRMQPGAWKRFAQEKLTAPLASASAIVGVGSAAEEDYRRRFPNTSHFNIPYYCDLSGFLAQPRRPPVPGEMTFLFCGQMNERKGVDLLFKAFDRLVAENLNVRLLLVGREGQLPQFIQDLSVKARDRVRYAGFQPPGRLPEYFAQADAFVLASRYDGWGVVVNQALGAGLPIICSDAVGAGHDLVEENVNGLRFRSDDAAELQRCMEQVLNNPETTWNWGEASRRKAVSLDPKVGAEKWVEVFRALERTQ